MHQTRRVLVFPLVQQNKRPIFPNDVVNVSPASPEKKLTTQTMDDIINKFKRKYDIRENCLTKKTQAIGPVFDRRSYNLLKLDNSDRKNMPKQVIHSARHAVHMEQPKVIVKFQNRNSPVTKERKSIQESIPKIPRKRQLRRNMNLILKKGTMFGKKLKQSNGVRLIYEDIELQDRQSMIHSYQRLKKLSQQESNTQLMRTQNEITHLTKKSTSFINRISNITTETEQESTPDVNKPDTNMIHQKPRHTFVKLPQAKPKKYCQTSVQEVIHDEIIKDSSIEEFFINIHPKPFSPRPLKYPQSKVETPVKTEKQERRYHRYELSGWQLEQGDPHNDWPSNY